MLLWPPAGRDTASIVAAAGRRVNHFLVMLEGATLASQWREVSALAAYGAVTFVLALRWFRWS
jgi:hypothetical protein